LFQERITLNSDITTQDEILIQKLVLHTDKPMYQHDRN